jgi:guanylate kinase
MKPARSKPSMRRGNIIVISAPSGAGKSTLIRRLMDSLSGLKFSVSTTTRGEKRP